MLTTGRLLHSIAHKAIYRQHVISQISTRCIHATAILLDDKNDGSEAKGKGAQGNINKSRSDIKIDDEFVSDSSSDSDTSDSDSDSDFMLKSFTTSKSKDEGTSEPVPPSEEAPSPSGSKWTSIVNSPVTEKPAEEEVFQLSSALNQLVKDSGSGDLVDQLQGMKLTKRQKYRVRKEEMEKHREWRKSLTPQQKEAEKKAARRAKRMTYHISQRNETFLKASPVFRAQVVTEECRAGFWANMWKWANPTLDENVEDIGRLQMGWQHITLPPDPRLKIDPNSEFYDHMRQSETALHKNAFYPPHKKVQMIQQIFMELRKTKKKMIMDPEMYDFMGYSDIPMLNQVMKIRQSPYIKNLRYIPQEEAMYMQEEGASRQVREKDYSVKKSLDKSLVAQIVDHSKTPRLMPRHKRPGYNPMKDKTATGQRMRDQIAQGKLKKDLKTGTWVKTTAEERGTVSQQRKERAVASGTSAGPSSSGKKVIVASGGGQKAYGGYKPPPSGVYKGKFGKMTPAGKGGYGQRK